MKLALMMMIQMGYVMRMFAQAISVITCISKMCDDFLYEFFSLFEFVFLLFFNSDACACDGNIKVMKKLMTPCNVIASNYASINCV